jgi:glycosyltransferase involved in cell wall biosynthesis
MEFIFVSNGIFPNSAGGIQRFSKLILEQFAHHPSVSKIHVIHTEKNKVFDSSVIEEYLVEGIDKSKNYLSELYRLSKRIYGVISQLPDQLPIYAQGFVLWYNIDVIKHRVIFNPHGLESFQATPYKEYLKVFPFRMLSGHLFKKSAATISLGGKLTGFIRKYISEQKIKVIPNAVNLPAERFESLKYNGPRLTVLFVSRFAYNKGIDVLFKTIEILNKNGFADKIDFVLGGKGPLFDFYNANNKYSNVKLLGFVDDDQLWHLYRTMDVFVFPTQYEGMPTVILEAMSNSMPIILSDVGATREIVDEQNGYILENKKDAAELAQLIINFYNLPVEEKRILGRNSYDKVKEKYTWDKVSATTLELIRSLSK